MKKLGKILVLGILFIACKNENQNSIEMPLMSDASVKTFASANSKVVFSESEKNQNINVNETVTRKLIKSGSVVFETKNLENTKNQVIFLVKKYNGYISSDSKNEFDDKENYYLNIRIPAQYFDTILSGISSQVSKFDTKEIRISDVTEEYLDIESRLKNKKELEKRYLEILQQAKSVEDILNVERELGKLREEIESTEGRLLYLKNQVSFATLSVSFYKKVNFETGFSERIGDSFKQGIKNLQSFFIVIIALWPFLVLFIIGGFLLKKWRNKKK
ncbi:MAG: DUF4349 domain-containing protein [Flavobacteriia bacterium]|nr:DUF4349 domain-containing protein [Flavobacteriia bacterium]OIP45098.1 MAG: hypothetical protein AUK46_13320 [Flavobacteriaceae bacterium CG2_30_31_66]PIV95294.1 MAG: hypothetical protein COW43_14235 [Flavobacteriaceae bacterium CG17_big_fil_post_rev_8_21_14_2_50_31_13]PIY13625.1 MAG: hypothetical protein COZ16_13410 [Flavobacteriaceae bacterium CG_4_10_14_3_um_filter_31_253]PIZ11814.1 MAG: hypothetical protein COY55_03035 [Flavobacteriaceae bacterium CG_4_10_14_0_8_um_filter_31_99]PJC08991